MPDSRIGAGANELMIAAGPGNQTPVPTELMRPCDEQSDRSAESRESRSHMPETRQADADALNDDPQLGPPIALHTALGLPS